MSAVAEDWNSLRENAGAIIDSEQTVLSLHEVAATLAETIPQLQVEYEEVVDILLQSGAPAAQVSVAQRQSLLQSESLVRLTKYWSVMRARYWLLTCLVVMQACLDEF